MAGRISGITIEIGGDTTKLQSALKGVDKTLKTTQSNLKDINKLLKLDPKNTELLQQKQKNLQTAIKGTKDRLKELKEAQKGVEQGSAEWDNLQREIIATEQDLKKLESDYRSFGSVAKQVVLAVGQQMKELGDKIQDVGQKFAPISKAAAGALTGMVAIGVKSVTTADDLNTLSKQTGFTTEELQKMEYAADRIDVPMETITGAAEKLTNKLRTSEKTFTDLGVATRNADGSFRSSTDIFYDTVAALSQIENETERDTKSMDIFGKSANDLAGIIDDGGAALKEYGDEAERLNLILDQETLDSLNKTNDALDKMKAQFKASALKLGAKIAEAAAPLVEKLAAGLEKLVGWLDRLTPQQAELVMKVLAIVAVLAPLIMLVGKLISGIGSLMIAVAVIGPVGIAIIAAIMAVIAVGVLLWKNWDTIKAKAIELKDNVVAGFQQLKADVVAGWEQLKADTVAAWENMKASISNAINNIKTAVVDRFNAVKATVSSVWNSIKSTISNAINGAVNTVKNAVQKIKNAMKFNWSLPPLKLPHITITYTEADSDLAKFLGIKRVPHLSVEWYKKAMQNPVLFTSPTVLPTASGMKGFGEAGAEIVMGLDKLRELVGAGQNVTVNVVLQGDARQMFKVVRQTNNVRTRATNYNALGAMA